MWERRTVGERGMRGESERGKSEGGEGEGGRVRKGEVREGRAREGEMRKAKVKGKRVIGWRERILSPPDILILVLIGHLDILATRLQLMLYQLPEVVMLNGKRSIKHIINVVLSAHETASDKPHTVYTMYTEHTSTM